MLLGFHENLRESIFAEVMMFGQGVDWIRVAKGRDSGAAAVIMPAAAGPIASCLWERLQTEWLFGFP